MSATKRDDVARLASRFRIGGRADSVVRHGSGHIHETWLSHVSTGCGVRRFIFQRINQQVFASPARVMENILRVTEHLRKKVLAEGGDPEREVLEVVPTLEGHAFLRTDTGEVWRCYRFIEGSVAQDTVRDVRQARQLGRAFGLFVSRLADLPGPRLHETIPAFAGGAQRIAALHSLLGSDPLGRSTGAEVEIAFAVAHEDRARLFSDLLGSGRVPERVIHFDAKINNVLLDAEGGEAHCVIDLDTVMPGTLLFDFGDSARRGACRADEDAIDTDAVRVDLELFGGLAQGWMESAGPLLTPEELQQLVPAARSVSFLLGLRFLSDHLAGDHYFRITRPGQNLDRCRMHFALSEDIDRHEGELRALIADCGRLPPFAGRG